MTRTTPPRPWDVASVFPALAGMARTATRLHPSPGDPTVHESSVGGPLLWPADEAWPVCADDHHPHRLTTLEDVRTLRRILTQAWQRPRPPRTNLLTPDEQAVVDRIHAGHDPSLLPAEPLPLIALAQLYARDVPDLPCPDGTDMLQVLWCPFSEIEDSPSAVHLRWRQSGSVRDVLAHPPAPDFVGLDDYVPAPCVLHPERVVEYPAAHELDPALTDRMCAWEKEQQQSEEQGLSYRGDLSVAPGWKVGGWSAPWTFCDPMEVRCDCGAPVAPLLTVDSSEWDGESSGWRPVEDRDEAGRPPYPDWDCPTMVTVGRGYTLQVYRCTDSYGHPPVTTLQ
ncbi:hypothetical protein [Streptomyces sp. NPDC059460]|uniref:hypothetical protein n=1 Tax=Streptomyces sp. NPDC059460 TaxID=3346840 RepID=UPI0036756CF7